MEARAQYTRSAQSPFLTLAENRWWGARWPIHQNPMLDDQVSHCSIDDQFAHYSMALKWTYHFYLGDSVAIEIRTIARSQVSGLFLFVKG